MQADEEAAAPLLQLLKRINEHYGAPERVTTRSDCAALNAAMR
jgi:hypothetical protein